MTSQSHDPRAYGGLAAGLCLLAAGPCLSLGHFTIKIKNTSELIVVCARGRWRYINRNPFDGTVIAPPAAQLAGPRTAWGFSH